MKFQANVPIHLWGDCLLTATYIINRTPTSVLQYKSPFEALFQKPPTYNHLRIFGCLAYASTLSLRKDKFASRAHKCVFLGYSSNQKAYKLLNLGTGQYLVSRDVYFYENIFLFAQHNSSHTQGLFSQQPSFVDTLSPLIKTTQQASPDTSLDQAQMSPELSSSPPQSEDQSPISSEPNSPPSDGIPLSDSLVVNVHVPNSRPTRTRTLPSKYADYTNLPSTLTKHQIHSSSSASVEPKFYHQAIEDPNWCKAMQIEINALEANNTWIIIDSPPGKKAVGCTS